MTMEGDSIVLQDRFNPISDMAEREKVLFICL